MTFGKSFLASSPMNVIVRTVVIPENNSGWDIDLVKLLVKVGKMTPISILDLTKRNSVRSGFSIEPE